jgi:hypothetical protein
MASHGVSWVPGAHVHFRSLDFFVTAEGGLARDSALIQPPRSVSLDTMVEALEELQLHVPRSAPPGATSSLISITSGWNTSLLSS